MLPRLPLAAPSNRAHDHPEHRLSTGEGEPAQNP